MLDCATEPSRRQFDSATQGLCPGAVGRLGGETRQNGEGRLEHLLTHVNIFPCRFLY